MNSLKKIYCRTYQKIMHFAMCFMPYREPKILESLKDIKTVLKAKGKTSPMLVTDQGVRRLGLTKSLEEDLLQNNFNLTVFDQTMPNPTINAVESALALYKQNKADCLIAFGGGSVMDLAKGVGARASNPQKSLRQMGGLLKVKHKLPLLLAIPTTAGTGSETTVAAVITDSETHHKYAINDFNLVPEYAVLDASLTINLPKFLTATTGMDALTHAVEAFIGGSTTPKTRRCALEATKMIFENLPECYHNNTNIIARQNMLKASYLAGMAFTRSYVGYVHAIAHSLGGKYGTAHGFANAVILPIMLREYGKKAEKKLAILARYSGVANIEDSNEVASKKFIERIDNLNTEMQIGHKFDFIKPEDIHELAKNADAEANPLYPVPKLLNKNELAEIYKKLG